MEFYMFHIPTIWNIYTYVANQQMHTEKNYALTCITNHMYYQSPTTTGSTLMKVAKVAKTCWLISTCDGAYFISVHVMVYYIMGKECWTSIHTLPFSITWMAELSAPRPSRTSPRYLCLLRGQLDRKARRPECGQKGPVTWKFQGPYQESNPETPTMWCSAPTNCSTHTTHSNYIHLKHFHLQSSDLFLLQ